MPTVIVRSTPPEYLAPESSRSMNNSQAHSNCEAEDGSVFWGDMGSVADYNIRILTCSRDKSFRNLLDRTRLP
jgi:hypothetical protein